MLALRFRFPGGLYHATPWGRHVNEGEVEWPPSPWRVARALLATGYNRMGWAPDLDAAARRVVLEIGRAPTTWWVPPGVVGHTRHYMPAYKGSTDKVLDAFVRIPRDEDVVAVLATDFDAEALAVLDGLLARLGWLGRAESWVEASRTDRVPDEGTHLRCVAQAEPPDAADPVRGYALLSDAAYATWRASEVAERESRLLLQRQEEDRRKGRKVRDALTKSDRERIADALPVDLVAALGARTADLRKERWSDPPGTLRTVCWRPRQALAPVLRPVPRRTRVERPKFALLQVTPDTREAATYTRLASAIRRADALHRALVKRAPVPEFTGSGFAGHQHAHLLPLSLERRVPRGRLPFAGIDHILVWAPGGLGPEACRALAGELVVFAEDLPRQFVNCVGFANAASEIAARCTAAARSRTWISETPFVPPRHLKRNGRSSLLGQVCEDLRDRGLPEPALVEVETEEGWIPASSWWELRGTSEARPAAGWRHFRVDRGRRGPRPPQRVVLGLRLTFADDVQGPICLGFASHFGLGRFVPAR